MKNCFKILILLLTVLQLPAENLPYELQNELSGQPTANARDRRRKFVGGSSKKNDVKFDYFIKSLALPGWGEYKLGNKGQAYAFFTSEALLIGSVVGLYYFSTVRTDDYQDYAALHAGVKKGGKQDSYWISIGNYDNTAAFNEQKNQERNFGARYLEADEQWQWDSSTNRKKYDNVRIEAENLETLSYYAIGAVLANHLLSAMNASFLAGTVNLEVNPDQEGELPQGKVSISIPLH